MTYTIKINDNSSEAKSIIKMLKALKKDYDFIDIEIEKNSQKDNLELLENRYKSFLKSKNGKDWEELKNEI